jgi:hypothetical protein
MLARCQSQIGKKKGGLVAAARGSAAVVQKISKREFKNRECPKKVVGTGVWRRR